MSNASSFGGGEPPRGRAYSPYRLANVPGGPRGAACPAGFGGGARSSRMPPLGADARYFAPRVATDQRRHPVARLHPSLVAARRADPRRGRAPRRDPADAERPPVRRAAAPAAVGVRHCLPARLHPPVGRDDDRTRRRWSARGRAGRSPGTARGVARSGRLGGAGDCSSCLIAIASSAVRSGPRVRPPLCLCTGCNGSGRVALLDPIRLLRAGVRRGAVRRGWRGSWRSARAAGRSGRGRRTSRTRGP
jgi:hypothetical protein